VEALVVILMGSRSDLKHGQNIANALADFGITYEIRVGSAHKTPAHALALLQAYEADPRPKVYITIAGRSNALSGFVDAQVTAPVIACPPPSDSFGGADVYSSLRMPGGVAPAVVLEPGNAALLAAKILGLFDPTVRERVIAMQKNAIERILTDDAELQQGERA
jgi:5-(carboxyamino)imidazole ribonucleotide mutase